MTTPISRLCTLEGRKLAERASAWADLREHALRDVREIPPRRVGGEIVAGIELVYRPAPEIETALRELVRAEGDCCGAGGIDWTFEAKEAESIVRVTAPEATLRSHEAKRIFSVLAGRP